MRTRFFSKYITAIATLIVGQIGYSQVDNNGLWDVQRVGSNPGIVGDNMTSVPIKFRIVSNYSQQNSAYSTATSALKNYGISFEQMGSKAWNWTAALNKTAVNFTASNEFRLLVGGAYNLLAKKETNDRLSFGVQLGVNQFNSNYRNLSFENQYDPTSSSGFDLNLANGELKTSQQRTKAIGNFGVYYRKSGNRILWSTGIGVLNIASSDRVSTITSDKVSPVQLTLTAQMKYNIDSTFSFNLAIQGVRQQTYQLLRSVQYLQWKHTSTYSSLAGVQLQSNGEVGAFLGIQQNQFTFRVGYVSAFRKKITWKQNRLELVVSADLTKGSTKHNKPSKTTEKKPD